MQPDFASQTSTNPSQQAPDSPIGDRASLPVTRELFSWSAPTRPFKRRDREFYITIAAVAFLVAVILFTIEGFLPVVVVFALVFLVYVMTSVAPGMTEHKITNRGVVFANKRYFWHELTRFWFTQRFGNDLLIVETTRLPGRLEMVIHPEDLGTIRQILQEFIDMEEATPNFMDKTASWFSKRIPLER